MLSDVRYSARQFRKHPLFTGAVILTLALGIGATSTVFSAVNAVLLRDLPIDDPRQVVRVVADDADTGVRPHLSHVEFVELREHTQSLAGLTALDAIQVGVQIGGASELVAGELVSGNFFDVLGVAPTVGRAFHPDEDRTPGSHPVAVISHALWHRLAGGDPGVVGSVVRINDRPFTVVGITPEGFAGTNIAVGRDIWVPVMMRNVITGDAAAVSMAGERERWMSDRRAAGFSAIGRLGAGVTRRQATAELSALAQRLAADRSDDVAPVPMFRVLPERAGLINPHQPAIVSLAGVLMMVVVTLGLTIACANVAALFLARAIARQREIGIRLALGAGRRRLLRQLFTESVLVAIPAGLIGLAIAVWLSPLYTTFLPQGVSLTLDFAPDWRVAAFTFAVTLTTTVLFGLAPAVLATKPDLVPVLKGEASPRGSRARVRALDAIIVLQFAIGIVVLTVAGTLVRDLQRRQAIDPGFATRDRLVAGVDVRAAGYDESAGRAFAEHVRTQLAALPAVSAVALARSAPMGLMPQTEVDAPAGETGSVSVGYNVVSDGYFGTLGLPLVRGREFTTADAPDAPPVAIVNQTMARRWFGEDDPVGRTIEADLHDRPVVVVGVAADAKYTSLTEPPRPFVYLSWRQQYRPQMTFHVHTAGDPGRVLPPVRATLRTTDPALPLAVLTTLSEAHKEDLALARTVTLLAGSLAALGLVLAAVGLYGVMTYVSGRRIREIGIRTALGAQQRQVTGLVLWWGLRLTGVAAAIGLFVATALARALAPFLADANGSNAVVFVVALAVLAVVALVSSGVPACRAARLDPMEALRHE